MTKLKIKVTVVLEVTIPDGMIVSTQEIVENMDYNFTTKGTSIGGLEEIEKTEIRDFDIIDAK